MQVKDINLEAIIKRREDYSKRSIAIEGLNETFEGELKAYEQMLSMINAPTTEFVSFFIDKIEKSDDTLDIDVAYTSEVIRILKLLNPCIEYKSELELYDAFEKKYCSTPSACSFLMIIDSKKIFSKKNNVFEKNEFESYVSGELAAYEEMLNDLDYEENIFFKKYKDTLDKNNEFIEEEMDNHYDVFIQNKQNNEKMIGYDNAIAEILELLKPESQFA